MSDINRESMIICVTGGIACGKSEVGRILGGMGFAALDADGVARDLMREGSPVFRAVVAHFGGRILTDEGGIARPMLGEIVFGDESERKVLNALVHPAVREFVSHWIAERRTGNTNAVVLIPLLYESGMETLEFDAVACVSSSEEEVLHRLGGRGLSQEEALSRIRSQMPLAEKEERADFTVPNFGTLGELEMATRNTVRAIRERMK